MIKIRVRWCACSLWRMLALGKLIGLLLFCVLLLHFILFLKTPSSNVHTKNTWNELAWLVMGTIVLVTLVLYDQYVCSLSVIIICQE